jgi:hypothetical protein
MEEYCTYIHIQLQTHSSLVRTGVLCYKTNNSKVLRDLEPGYKELRKSSGFQTQQYLWWRQRIWAPESPFG